MTVLLVLLAFATGAPDVSCSKQGASRFEGYDRLTLNRSKFICDGYYNESKRWLILNVEGVAKEYCNVPKDVWAAMKKTPDYGRYYNLHIQGHYAC